MYLFQHNLACLLRLITGSVIFTVIDTITDTLLTDTSVVATSELSCCTCIIVAVQFVGSIPTIILMIALPSFKDASTVATSVLGFSTRVFTAIINILV